MPIIYVAFWLCFVPKRTLHLRYMIDWILFPLVYALYTVLHGQASGFYPYYFYFVDVANLGLDQVLRNMGRFLVFLALVGAAFILVDRILGRLGHRAPAAPPEPAAIGPAPAKSVAETPPAV
jgi:hypothetical protein